MVFEAPGTLKCAHLEFSGGPKGRRGFTRQPESPNVHIHGSWPSRAVPGFGEKTPRDREKERKWGRGEGKKARNFGRSGGGGPARGVRRTGVRPGGGSSAGGGPVEEIKKSKKSKHLKNN